MKLSDLLRVARTWVGTPYHHQGRVKQVGVDCIGLIFGIGKEAGAPDFDRAEFQTYPRKPPKNGPTIIDWFDGIIGGGIDNPLPGYIGVFYISTTRKVPHHIGLMTDYGILHTHSKEGKVVEHLFNEEWRSKMIRFYRFPGLEE